MQKIGQDETAWHTLYYHADQDAYWELRYPQGEMHGGGPPELARVTDTKGIEKDFKVNRQGG